MCWVVAGKIVATYTTTDGTPKTNLLLISGWWGLSRHFHYMPELGAALCWGLPALFQGAMPYATSFAVVLGVSVYAHPLA